MEMSYALVTIGAAVIGALIQAFGRDLWDMLPRSGPKYPLFNGCWDAVWMITGDDGSEREYIHDTVDLKQRGRSVSGKGRDSRGRGDYVLHGRFNSHGIVTLAYEYERAAMAGSVTLKADPVPNSATGRWHGYTQEDEVVSGRVVWTKKPS